VNGAPVIVSDASPLIALTQVGQLLLLPRLFTYVWIPAAVAHEIARTVAAADWLRVEAPASVPSRIPATLGAGEREAMALALQYETLLLVDETRARSAAARLGLQTVGTLGILIRAKNAGFLSAITPVIDELIGTHHFWASDALREKTLRLAGEA